MMQPTLAPARALIADVERLMREQLLARLQQAWPALQIVGQARDGWEAVQMAHDFRPDVVFLDIRMPGQNGIDAARQIIDLDDWHGALVFVTAYDEYAVAAFERGAVDYLLKPVELPRLQLTVLRLQERLQQRNQPNAGAPPDEHNALAALLQQLQDRLQPEKARTTLRWLQCTTGNTTRMVSVADVLFFRSDEKYTRVQLADQEALIRMPIKDLVEQLDNSQFWQIHRSTIVAVKAIAAVQRDDTGRQRVTIKNHPEVLEVSRAFSHLFRQGTA